MKRRLTACVSVLCIALGMLLFPVVQAAQTPETELTALGAPVTVGWGRDYRFTVGRYNRTHTLTVDYLDYPGMMYWSLDEPTQNTYSLELYKQEIVVQSNGEEQQVDICVASSGQWSAIRPADTPSDGTAYGCSYLFLLDDRESGTYYYKIRSLGDGVTYQDSEEKTSNFWEYILPERTVTRINSSGNIVWETKQVLDSAGTPMMDSDGNPVTEVNVVTDVVVSRLARLEAPKWDGVHLGSVQAVDKENTAGFQFRWFYQADPDDEESKLVEIGSVFSFQNTGSAFQVTDRMLEQYGSGWYSVQVRVLSTNINKICSSYWSPMSRQRFIAHENSALAQIASTVRTDSLPEEKQKAINEVRAIGAETLLTELAADRNNSGVAKHLQYLEGVTGNQAKISVSVTSAGFTQEDVTVIGAGMNVDLGDTVTLEIADPEEDTVLPAEYGNAVRFSMKLTDSTGKSLSANSGELAVPVKITLPIPVRIPPEYFVILHHHTDGTIEEIRSPYVYKTQRRGESGEVIEEWFATFVLRSFSDFTMAERLESPVEVTYRLPGGWNGSAYCAVYAQGGRMLAVTPWNAGETRKTILCDSTAAVSVKIIALDESGLPAFAAQAAEVSG